MADNLTHPAYPPVTFAELFAGLIAVVTDTGFKPDGVALADLQTTLKDQETQDAADKLAEARYAQSHVAFLEAQAARWELYFQVLSQARARFRKDRAIRERLDELKRNTGRKGPKEPRADGTSDGKDPKGTQGPKGTETHDASEPPKPHETPEGANPPKT